MISSYLAFHGWALRSAGDSVHKPWAIILAFMPGLKLQENVPLAPLTTLRVGGAARYFFEATSAEEVQLALLWSLDKKQPMFVLGGGSNLLVADSGFPGLVVKMGLLGITESKRSDKRIFEAGAGEDWDKLVALAVAGECAGIETLSGIPGTVGGTPVQNVGAYGQEVSETITSVRVLELASGKILDFNNDACGFTYRTSIFNSTHKDKYIVLRVTYELTPDGAPNLEYADLKTYFTGKDGKPTLQRTREAVREIRRSKAMLIVEGDADFRSAGSFFKNPIMDIAAAERVNAIGREKLSGKTPPQYPAGEGKVKLSAAWLVENAGFHKGFTLGPAAISSKHTLAIINKGGAKAADILALKRRVQTGVRDLFGVELHPEPVFLGFDGQPGFE